MNEFPSVYHQQWVKFDKTMVLKLIRANVTLQSMAERPKEIAWVVSHCRTKSKRAAYVEALKDYIDVDIFGRCTGIPCGSTYTPTIWVFFLAEDNVFFLTQPRVFWYVEEKIQILFGFWAKPMPGLCDRKVLECLYVGYGTCGYGRVSYLNYRSFC